jgi:cardiolipin synthase
MADTLFNLPNALTLTRVAIVPFVVLFARNGQPNAAGILATLAALTDFFDGRLARGLNRTSALGSILDPVSDKIMVISLFGLLALTGVLPTWIFVLSTVRNVSQLLSIPILIFWKRIAFKVRPAFIPKFASAFSFAILIVGLFAGSSDHGQIRGVLFLASLLLALLEIHILVTYWPRFFQILTGRHDTFE